MATNLSTLRTRARTRADAVGNNFFDDSEIDDYINVGIGELHDLLVLKFEDYYDTSLTFDLVSGQSNYTFSAIGCANFYKCLGVDITDSGETSRVRRFSFKERNNYSSNDQTLSRGGVSAYLFQIRGDSVEFIPDPNTTSEIRLWYVPTFTKLGADTDEISSRIMSNWEEYAILTAVIKMKEKEELSTSVLKEELDALRDRIEAAATNRDAGEQTAITDEMAGTSFGLFGRF